MNHSGQLKELHDDKYQTTVYLGPAVAGATGTQAAYVALSSAVGSVPMHGVSARSAVKPASGQLNQVCRPFECKTLVVKIVGTVDNRRQDN